MITSNDTILVIGTDPRPVGYSKEPGANTTITAAARHADAWRIGGGT